ncbi:hypothetical protein Tco_0941547 [Tanacetum coccineum]|uniref:TPX2 central domain-containing protein n=1 Tax=Tanacetum coccineum TaxID=301880 RepID=A0ABQ5DRA7_9ASTR
MTAGNGTESKEQDSSSRSGNDAHTDDADIRPIYNEEPMAKEKGFAIAALKNELRKLTGNSVNTKFAKPSILGKPVLQPHRNQFVARQLTAFKSERPKISKERFASQVDVSNDLSKPVTTHYLPKRREFAKPHNMIATSSSRFLCNKIPKRSSTPVLTVPSNKTITRNKPIEQTRFAKKPERQIPKGHRFSIKNTSVVHKKTMTPRSCLKWKPTGRVFKNVVLRWVPTRKTFASSTTKVDSEPPNGSNADITNQCESEQALDVSAGTLLSTGLSSSSNDFVITVQNSGIQRPPSNEQTKFKGGSKSVFL